MTLRTWIIEWINKFVIESAIEIQEQTQLNEMLTVAKDKENFFP